MLPSATSQAPGISPLPGVSPSAMMTAAAARDEDSIFGAGADETFFSSIGALVASPPPSSHGTSPDLRWPCSADGAAGLLACERVAKPSPSTQEIFDNSGAAAAEGPFSLPLVASSIPSGQSLGPPRPMLHPGSSADPVGGIEPMAPAEAPATGTSPPPPRPSAPAASRAKKLPGLSKSRAKGGGTRQARKSKSGTSNAAAAAARQEAGLEDGEPDNIVCLLAVGSKTQQLARADVSGGGGGGGNNNDGSSTVAGNAASLADTVKMLTVEMGRNGRELETEHVETGQRAVLQVEALARCDMRFGMVVLEVEESLVAAAETAGELRYLSAWWWLCAGCVWGVLGVVFCLRNSSNFDLTHPSVLSATTRQLCLHRTGTEKRGILSRRTYGTSQDFLSRKTCSDFRFFYYS